MLRKVCQSLLFGSLAVHTACLPSNTPPLSSRQTQHQKGSHVSGGEEYVVIVDKDQVGGDAVLSRLDLSAAHPDVSYTFDNAGFKGFAARMKNHCLEALGNMSDVLHVESKVAARSVDTVRIESPWGLQRISSKGYMFGDPQSLKYDYTYSSSELGKGVDIYVLDTGIYTASKVFQGRARMGWSFESDTEDHDGHGTHVSGTAAGSTFGVASGANIIGVKVLGNDGGGSSTDTIAGIDYVIKQHTERKSQPGFTGSIMSMSWGLETKSPSIQAAISAAIGEGIHVSVAAGNSADDACAISPSMAGGSNSAAVVVGSIDETSEISSFSNTGPCVDLYAPGENILSAWIGSANVVQYMSGTSMACPHVTGVMAYLLGTDGSLANDPSALKSKLLGMAVKDLVHGGAVMGDKFLLVNNGIGGASKDLSLATTKLRRSLPKRLFGSWSSGWRSKGGGWRYASDGDRRLSF